MNRLLIFSGIWFIRAMAKHGNPQLKFSVIFHRNISNEGFIRAKERHTMYLLIPFLFIFLVIQTGCQTPSQYRQEADKVAGGIISEKQKQALDFIKENVLDVFDTTGVQDVLNKAVFEVLKYIHVYPGAMNNLKDKDGNVLPDCYLMKNGSTALDFAYKIHTDIGKKFVKAMDVKRKTPVGKEHILKDGDVVEILTSK